MSTVISLDLGTQVVKAAVLSGGRKSLRVVSGHERALAATETMDEWLRGLEPALVSLRREIGRRSAPVVVAIPGQLALLRTLDVPFTRPSDIRRTIATEIEPLLPVAVEQVVVDYRVVGAEGPRTSLFAAAMPKADLRALLGVIRRAGFDPDEVTLDLFAAAQIVSWGFSPLAFEHVLVLDLGAGGTKAAFLREGRFVSGRAFRTAGRSLTREIQKKLGVSAEAAEAMKVEPAAMDDISSADVRQAFADHYERIAREVRIFLASLGQAGTVDVLLLAGGGGRIQGIESFFRPAMGKDVRRVAMPPGVHLDPRVPLAPDGGGAGLAVAVGAALPRLGACAPGVNFLQDEFRTRTLVHAAQAPLAAAATLLAASALLLGLRFHQDLGLCRSQQAELAAAQRTLWRGVFGPEEMPASGVLKRLNARMDEARAKLDRQTTGPERRSAVLTLTEILRSVPADKPFTIHGVDVTSAGASLSGETDSLTSAKEIEQAINGSPLLECHLENATAQPGKVTFGLEIQFRDGSGSKTQR